MVVIKTQIGAVLEGLRIWADVIICGPNRGLTARQKSGLANDEEQSYKKVLQEKWYFRVSNMIYRYF